MFAKFKLFVYSFLEQNSNVRFACNRKDNCKSRTQLAGCKKGVNGQFTLGTCATFHRPVLGLSDSTLMRRVVYTAKFYTFMYLVFTLLAALLVLLYCWIVMSKIDLIYFFSYNGQHSTVTLEVIDSFQNSYKNHRLSLSKNVCLSSLTKPFCK